MTALLDRFFIGGWALLVVTVLLGAFPAIVAHIPHPELIRPIVVPFALISVVYGIARIFISGMKRASPNR